MSLQRWYVASELDTVTAGNCAKIYNVRPQDRGMLGYKQKRLNNGLVCKLYSTKEVMKVARSIHFKKEVTTTTSLQKVCKQLGLNTKGSYDTLRRRIGVRMASI